MTGRERVWAKTKPQKKDPKTEFMTFTTTEAVTSANFLDGKRGLCDDHARWSPPRNDIRPAWCRYPQYISQFDEFISDSDCQSVGKHFNDGFENARVLRRGPGNTLPPEYIYVGPYDQMLKSFVESVVAFLSDPSHTRISEFICANSDYSHLDGSHWISVVYELKDKNAQSRRNTTDISQQQRISSGPASAHSLRGLMLNV